MLTGEVMTYACSDAGGYSLVSTPVTTPNVYTVPLGRCDVDWHVDRGIVTLTCVERGMIKV